MEKYDRIVASKHFLAAAKDAELYLREVKEKLKTNKSYEHVYDDHLAKFYVFNHLHGRPFLASRNSLLVELRQLQSSSIPTPAEAFIAERFERYRRAYLSGVIERYESQVDVNGD